MLQRTHKKQQTAKKKQQISGKQAFQNKVTIQWKHQIPQVNSEKRKKETIKFGCNILKMYNEVFFTL